jgi:hypothetical protein
MVNAPQAQALLHFTASLTQVQKKEFIDLVRNSAFSPDLVPPSGKNARLLLAPPKSNNILTPGCIC